MIVELDSQWIDIKEIKTTVNKMILYYWFDEDYIGKRVIIWGTSGFANFFSVF